MADKKLVGVPLKVSVAQEAKQLGTPVGLLRNGQRDFSDAIALYLLAHARLSGKTLKLMLSDVSCTAVPTDRSCVWW